MHGLLDYGVADVLYVQARVTCCCVTLTPAVSSQTIPTFDTIPVAGRVAILLYDWIVRMIKFVGTLPLESIVDVQGVLVEANVKSCTQVRWSAMNKYLHRITPTLQSVR